VSRRLVIAAGAAGLAAIVLPPALRPAPALVWNTTASAPLGLYLTRPERRPAVGDWVVIRPSAALAEWLAAKGFLPSGALLLKRIAAVAPSIVCRIGAEVSIDGRRAAAALARDRVGRPLPVWRGCHRLTADEVFVLMPAPHSLDSRYFGALPRRLIVGRAAPWLVVDEAEDAH
jgi:type IV secretory pathway protease TraF